MDKHLQKATGAYYTPEPVVRSLVSWAVHDSKDRLLDPACGDGRFLMFHPNSVGVEQDPAAASIVHARSPGSLIHQGDFFSWACRTQERFECAAGNPPFIRYQRFSGDVRLAAQSLCARNGAIFSALSSSWAPFLVATASLLKTGGRMAFVVPAEIGHAPYAKPVLEYLANHFNHVQIIAVQRKMFPSLAEDCWLLYADGFGGATSSFILSPMTQFGFMKRPPSLGLRVPVHQWQEWSFRLRPFLMPKDVRQLYRELAFGAPRLKDVARVGIGYVTGDNEFFHLRPSFAQEAGIPENLLCPTIRNSKLLTGRAVTRSKVEAWRGTDEPNFLLRLTRERKVHPCVQKYLDSEAGQQARETYKCRNRDPWYSVPDVTIPDAFLAYMSSKGPALVANQAGCSGTNSVHMLTLTGAMSISELQNRWKNSLTCLSCEIEGHPLGGGMLKLEPTEAGRIVLAAQVPASREEKDIIANGINDLRKWRHCG